MTVMRSVFYIPGNNEKMISKAPDTPADIITLDLEDSVPPAEKPRARDMVRENLKFAGSGGSTVYVNSNGQLGILTSSRRYKEDIQDIGDTSSGLMQLRPVTFYYKPEYSKYWDSSKHTYEEYQGMNL